MAKWLNSHGIAGIVLKYRLPLHDHQSEAYFTPLMDAQRAIRLTRIHAEEWNIDPNQVGVMGFSAGGHLASSLSVHYDREVYEAVDEIDKISAKPDFSILLYPVISLKSGVTHGGSRNNLLGAQKDDQQMIELFSNEIQVNKMTPRAILIHSSDDLAVSVKNSINYYEALVGAGIPAEMHIYPYGGHGYSLAINQGRLSHWPDRVIEWLQALDAD
jgi:acetyl esterase/lipase